MKENTYRVTKFDFLINLISSKRRNNRHVKHHIIFNIVINSSPQLIDRK